MVASEDDKALMTRCQAGDHEAFEDLVRTHQRMIHALCYRMTGSTADAEDLAQETFIQAAQHLAGFRAEARFSSWLYRIALNLCLNWQKQCQRRQRLQEALSQHLPAAAPEDSRQTHQVQEALMKLHPKQRAAVVLTIYDGLNHAEAAQALGCSETTVSWRLFAARRKLKRLLKNLSPGGAAS
jgi:RNA polymerase sigma-70 factor (ECF subfamily)